MGRFILLVLSAMLSASAWGAQSVHKPESASALIKADDVTFNNNGTTSDRLCVSNEPQPVLWYFNLSSYSDQTITSDVSLTCGAYQSDDNVTFNVYACPLPWEQTTVTWANYLGGTDWQVFFGFPIGTLSNIGTVDSRHFAGTIDKTIIQDWLDHPYTNYGIAMISLESDFNACLFTRSCTWKPDDQPHINFQSIREPAYACDPDPQNGKTEVDPEEVILSWTSGDYTADVNGHDIYFGTNFEDVNNATIYNDPHNVYKGTQDKKDNYYPTTGSLSLNFGQTYHWRIDEVNNTTGIPFKGKIWCFTTDSGKATNPYPANGATGVEPAVVLTWSPGNYATSHDVYFGTSFEQVSEADHSYPMGPDEVYRARRNVNSYPICETLGAGMTYFWRIDGVLDTNILVGDIWSFTTMGGEAREPRPVNGTTGINIEALKLIWTPGDWAADIHGHDVYFGTNYKEVRDINTGDPDPNGVYKGRQDTDSYEPDSLDFETTYYWRVDEVNTVHPDEQWRGDIWSFTLPDYITVDDFNNYNCNGTAGPFCPYYKDGDLWHVWQDGKHQQLESRLTNAQSGSLIYLSGTLVRYEYDNNGIEENGIEEGFYSEIVREYADEGADFTAGRTLQQKLKALELTFTGDADNNANAVYDRMYVGLEDTNGNFAMALHTDPNAGQKESYQNWKIALNDFNHPQAVDLEHVKFIYIGFGVRGNPPGAVPGGQGAVYIDEILLYPSRCLSEYKPAADLSGDCAVDIEDLEIMAIQWLLGDEIIKIEEIAQPTDPLVWYKFDESSGTTAADEMGNYNATVRNVASETWDITGGYNGNGCINLSFGNQTNVIVPPELFDQIDDRMTICVWVNGDRQHPPAENWESIFSNNDNLYCCCPTPPAPIFEAGPAVYFHSGNGVGENVSIIWAEPKPEDYTGRWNHFAFVKDYQQNTMDIYHNGRLVAHNPAASASMVNVIEFYIGSMGQNYAYWYGRLDDFRIYNYALSGSEVAYLATNGTGSLCLTLVSPANIYDAPPNIVNFRDFALFADMWLDEKLWPTP